METIGYNFSYCICALVIVLLSYVFLFTRKDMRRRNSRLFLGVQIVQMAIITLNIVRMYLDNVPGRFPLPLRSVFDGIYLAAHQTLAPLITWYFISFTGMRHKMSKTARILYLMPLVCLSYLTIIIPQIRQYMYSYDENLVFHLGPAYIWTVPMGGMFYCVVIAYVAIRSRHRLSREQKNAIVFLIIFCSTPSFVQNIWMPTQQFSVFFEAVGIFVVLLTIDNQNWVYHSATQTYNRLTMQRHLEGDIEAGNTFDAVIVTISRKAYFEIASAGNEEFQLLMGTIGNYMKGLHGRPDVYYCERGTYVITLYNDSPWKASDLQAELKTRFSMTWTLTVGETDRQIHVPVRLTSVNVPGDADSIEKLFRLTDFPYDAETDEPLVVEAKTLVMAEQQYQEVMNSDDDAAEEKEEEYELPEELSSMMDDFTSHIRDLTPMEKKVMLCYMDGYEITDLPDLLNVTINTVRKHNRSIYHKLNVGSKEELMIYLDILDRCNRLEPIENALGKDNSSKD